ncbi:MAG: DinB family protein [Longimicrobiaceae bacterium]
MKRLILPLALTLIAAPLAAQQAAPADQGSVAATRALWRMMSGYVQRSAEQMPEADFAYRPVDGVRTFGQMVAHLAGSQYMFCAAATGDAARGEDDVERTRTTKAAIVQAFSESTAYCERAYTQADAAAAQPITLFGQPRTRFFALTMNAVHVGEHYGNLVTYMRMKGMVPPSSQPQGQ